VRRLSAEVTAVSEAVATRTAALEALRTEHDSLRAESVWITRLGLRGTAC
jgi:hypothetical protein